MKTYSLIFSLACILALSTGCNKQEPTETSPAGRPAATATTASEEIRQATNAVQEQAAAAQRTANDAVADLQEQASDAKETVDQAAADVQDQATSISSKAQVTIDNAKKLIAEKNWSEALKSLGELAGLQLTPEQQAAVASLKEQAQKLAQDAASSKVADKAENAVGNLLNR